jgi:hypothetical protein
MATSTSTDRVRAMRERRRLALQAADAAEVALRHADDLLAPAVREALAALDLDGKDAAAAKLAELLAVTIDRAKSQEWAVRWLAPELLRVLEQLHATPMSRSKQLKKRDPARANRVQELRAAHKRRYG